jgi:hypothetical protein
MVRVYPVTDQGSARDVVYIIEAVGSGMVKVGFTSDLQKRLRALRTSCPHHIRVLQTYEGGPAKERELHDRWEKHRVRHEWFKLGPIVRDLGINLADLPVGHPLFSTGEVEDFVERTLPPRPPPEPRPDPIKEWIDSISKEEFQELLDSIPWP